MQYEKRKRVHRTRVHDHAHGLVLDETIRTGSETFLVETVQREGKIDSWSLLEHVLQDQEQ